MPLSFSGLVNDRHFAVPLALILSHSYHTIDKEVVKIKDEVPQPPTQVPPLSGDKSLVPLLLTHQTNPFEWLIKEVQPSNIQGFYF